MRRFHVVGQLGVGLLIGRASYDGPVLGGYQAQYRETITAFLPSAALGAVYQVDSRWALGAAAIGGLSSGDVSVSPAHGIPGAPSTNVDLLGGELLGRSSFGGALDPTLDLSLGFSLGAMIGGSDAIYSPGLVANDDAFNDMPGITGQVALELRGLEFLSFSPFCGLRGARFWHGSSAATILVLSLGVSLFL